MEKSYTIDLIWKFTLEVIFRIPVMPSMNPTTDANSFSGLLDAGSTTVGLNSFITIVFCQIIFVDFEIN